MRILITGASGMLGSNLCIGAIDAGHEVIASSFSQRIQWPGLPWYQADLTDSASARKLLGAAQPDWIINCAGATDVDRCEREPNWADSLNVEIPRNLADQSTARLVHISTDAVFGGDSALNTEARFPHPINHYGASKFLGEQAALSNPAETAIIRTNFYGWSPPGRQSLAEWFLVRLQADQECPGFTDVTFSPMLINELVKVLLLVVDKELSGLYHVGSRDAMSKYEFGVLIADTFDLNSQLIIPSISGQSGLVAPRPSSLVLSSDKIERDLNIGLPEISDGVDEFERLGKSGYSKRLHSLFRLKLESPTRL